MRVNIVVPSYQEGGRLDQAAFTKFIDDHPDVLFTLVNDGSRDNTLDVLQTIRAHCPARVEVVDLPVNVGKAEAVRQGTAVALAGDAPYIGYWDADLATPLSSIPELTRVLDEHPGIDIVLGARVRLLGRRIDRKPIRHYFGRLFATGASLALSLPVYDTQCGAKLMRRGPLVDGLFDTPFGSRWIFDVELIARYLVKGGTSAGLYEYALASWTDVADSKVKPADFFRAFGELMRIYHRYAVGQPLRPVVLFLTNTFARYLGVGALGTLLHYLVLILLVEGLGARPTVGAVAGATAGAVANYFLNYHLTFTSRSGHARTFPKFAVVAAASVFISGLGVRLATLGGINYLLAQLVCTVVSLGLGFVVNRAWTFSD